MKSDIKRRKIGYEGQNMSRVLDIIMMKEGRFLSVRDKKE